MAGSSGRWDRASPSKASVPKSVEFATTGGMLIAAPTFDWL